jgi:hypothetical protein
LVEGGGLDGGGLDGAGSLGGGFTGAGLETTTTSFEFTNLTVADLPARSRTVTVSLLRDELTLAEAGLTAMEERVR